MPPGQVEIPGHGLLPEVFVNTLGLRFILVRPGTFLMGMRPEEQAVMKGNTANTVGDVRPLVRVILTRPYYLANVEIGTAHGCLYDLPRSAADYVPNSESYWAYRRFCYTLAEREGRAYRLPTGAEWEYAARAGTTTPWPWGNSMEGIEAYEYIGCRTCWTAFEFLPGGLRLPNPWGFYDMLGNKSEWIADYQWPADMFTSKEPLCDPAGPTEAEVQRHAREEKSGYSWILRHLKRGGSNRHYISWASPGMSGRGKCPNWSSNQAWGARLAMDASEVVRTADFAAAKAKARQDLADTLVIMANEAVVRMDLGDNHIANHDEDRPGTATDVVIQLYREALENAPGHAEAKARLAELETATSRMPAK
jgi:formylglycine-generating enzyme required for sulfatase activity